MFEHLCDGAKLQDHELLEILLFYAIPRKNTNPIAHSLLNAFGSLEGVFSASKEKLLEVSGIGEATATYLTALSTLFSRLRTPQEGPPKIYNVHSFNKYLDKTLKECAEEVLHVYCLDAGHAVKFVKTFTSCLPDRVDIPPDEIGHVIATQRPHSVILAHNHPNHLTNPSAADDRFTKQIQMLCMIHGCTVDDHVVVGIGEPFSYFLTGRLQKIKDECYRNLTEGPYLY